jgi:hypothetical protein
MIQAERESRAFVPRESQFGAYARKLAVISLWNSVFAGLLLLIALPEKVGGMLLFGTLILQFWGMIWLAWVPAIVVFLWKWRLGLSAQTWKLVGVATLVFLGEMGTVLWVPIEAGW